MPPYWYRCDHLIGIDATTWSNERGFGRFTRELVKALVAHNSGFRYTLLFDQLPNDSLSEGVGDYLRFDGALSQ